MLNFLFSSIVLILFFEFVSSNYHYDTKSRTSINLSAKQEWLIKNHKVTDKLICLTKCNNDDRCLTITFSGSQLSDNCFLYKKYFGQTDLIQSSDTDLYEKHCKYKLNFEIKLFTI
jgi:hypothetical protein